MKDMDNLPKFKFVKPIGGFHGISAIFPKLQDIFDYEEKKIIINQGYPRFVTHPALKSIEISNKKSFKAIGAISCHSYESALFLVIDYFFKKGNKLFYKDRTFKPFFKYLIQKFPDVIERKDPLKADILFLTQDESQDYNFSEGKIYVGLIEDEIEDLSPPFKHFDILIRHDRKNDIGIILIYKIKHATLEIFRRHCGFNVSSRKLVKKNKVSEETIKENQSNLEKKLLNLEHLSKGYCYFYPSGMAALFSSIFSLLSEKRTNFIALGSLYVDTLRILEKWPEKYGLSESIFLRDEIIRNLIIKINDKTAGIILELPSNPLIQLLDLEEIVKIAHSKGAKVIVDNTIATPYNFNPFNYGVDIVVHSTTKFLSGKNNHIGGVLLTNDDKLGEEIKNFNDLVDLGMDFNEIKTLARNIRKFEKRMAIINYNSKIIAKFLNNHDSIQKVYYPALDNDPNNVLFKRYFKGGSGLMSFILKESTRENAEKFYDNVGPPILKGPSLGSEKTLLSPYVVMAHYNDSKEELERLGLDFYLMRISVGIEPIEQLINSLGHALKFLE